MNMLKDEKVVIESDNNILTLTTHRIRYETKIWGKAHVTSIMLDELCSCSLRYKSSIILLIIGIVFGGALVIGGLASGESGSVGPGFIIGIIFIAAYFLTRKISLSFRSGGDSINVSLNNMSFENAKKFIDEVETVKNTRYLILK